ncbi:hypothetical protein XacyCFBP1159_16860 [Xanthomonas arboricola pv. corylina]|nr:hypothetical protein XacyCFBP1159_16860 [Xanthomonas arboricola pv. corylina]
MRDGIAAFQIQVARAELDGLAHRLGQTRWPSKETVEDHSQGPQSERIRRLVDRWQSGYDWRATERRPALPGWTTTTMRMATGRRSAAASAKRRTCCPSSGTPTTTPKPPPCSTRRPARCCAPRWTRCGSPRASCARATRSVRCRLPTRRWASSSRCSRPNASTWRGSARSCRRSTPAAA